MAYRSSDGSWHTVKANEPISLDVPLEKKDVVDGNEIWRKLALKDFNNGK